MSARPGAQLLLRIFYMKLASIALREEIVVELSKSYGEAGIARTMARLSIPPGQTTVRVNSLITSSSLVAENLNTKFQLKVVHTFRHSTGLMFR